MKTAEDILDIHCSTIYNKTTGEEEIWSSKSAVLIAMEEYAMEYYTKQLSLTAVVQAKPEVCDHNFIDSKVHLGCSVCVDCHIVIPKAN